MTNAEIEEHADETIRDLKYSNSEDLARRFEIAVVRLLSEIARRLPMPADPNYDPRAQGASRSPILPRRSDD